MQPDPGQDQPLIAYYKGAAPIMRIVPASRWRTWMDETIGRNANRCLPLLVANEAGWFLLNERTFTAEWSGGEGAHSLTVRYDGVKPPAGATTTFGHGILTFRIPYLFRTPAGWDLLVRGPTNLPKEDITPLDGLVETDWAVNPFTMNWKFARPGTVVFEEGEPFCMITPIRRRDIETFAPQIRSASEDDAGLAAAWEASETSRRELSVRKFLGQFSGAGQDTLGAWEADYFRGQTGAGEQAPDHITKRRLRPFTDEA